VLTLIFHQIFSMRFSARSDKRPKRLPYGCVCPVPHQKVFFGYEKRFLHGDWHLSRKDNIWRRLEWRYERGRQQTLFLSCRQTAILLTEVRLLYQCVGMAGKNSRQI